MADHASVLVVAEAYIAVRAFHDLAAAVALHDRCPCPSGPEDHYLSALLESTVHMVYQLAREVAVHASFATLCLCVNYLNVR